MTPRKGIRCFIAPRDAERDPGFRSEIERFAQVGLRVYASVMLLIILIDVVVSALGVQYGHGHGVEVTWETSLLAGLIWLIFTGGVLALSWTRVGAEWGRFIVAAAMVLSMSVMVSGAIMVGWGTAFAQHGIAATMFLLMGVATMPYRVHHTIALGGVLTLNYWLGLRLLPGWFGVPDIDIPAYPFIYMLGLTCGAAAASALLYTSRYYQYLTRREAEDLRDRVVEKEHEFRTLVENSIDGIFSVDRANGQFVSANPALADMLGLPVEEIVGKHFSEVIHPDDRERVIENYKRRIRGEPVPHRYNVKLIRAGSDAPIICDMTIHRRAPGNLTRGAVRDITDQVEMERSIREQASALGRQNTMLRETQSQLVQSEKMAALGNLVAGVAHEINTPLGSIHSNADVAARAMEIVKAGFADPDAIDRTRLERAVEILEESNITTGTATDRIVKIVKSLRSFARLDEAELQKVDLHECIESTLTLVHHEIKTRITVVRDFGELPTIACYPNQLNQVFMNLLVNAIHAISGEGTITITTRAGDDTVSTTIADTGCGIPCECLDKIFDPGFTTKGVGVGTGLGLSIVYKIIEAHNGRIDVESTVGEGTTFTITLPATTTDVAGSSQGGAE